MFLNENKEVILILEHFKLFKFNRKLVKLYNSTPTYDKYNDNVDYKFNSYDSFCKNKDVIRSVLPLESLKISNDTIMHHKVTYDKKEFNTVILNPVNNVLLLFLDEYDNLEYNNKMYFYKTFNETLELLLKLIKEKVHYHNSNEVVELIKELMVNLPENTHDRESKNLGHDVLKEKLKFELEFLKRLNSKE